MMSDDGDLLIPDIESKVGSIVVFPPSAIVDDDTALCRLETYLTAEFPEQRFIMARGAPEPDEALRAGFLVSYPDEPPEPTELDKAVIRQVLDRVAEFVESRGRLH